MHPSLFERALDRIVGPILPDRIARPVRFLARLAEGSTTRAAELGYLPDSAIRFSPAARTLDEAEEAALGTTCERAGIADGARVLDLGCGWGSLSLWIAERYPRCQVSAVSSSRAQRELILARSAQRGLDNIEVIGADLNDLMPSDDLLPRFQRDLALVRQWRWSGLHYQKTAEAWLANLDRNRERVLATLANTYGAEQVGLWLGRWRIFFMACAELFGYRAGREWWVSHYLFEPIHDHRSRP